jgi:hypothetical protein
MLTIAAIASTPVPKDEPYTIEVRSVAGAASGPTYYLVTVTVTEKATGKVVFHPRVQTKAGTQAEITSDPDPNGLTYEARITVDALGKATVDFRAYARVIQRSRSSS